MQRQEKGWGRERWLRRIKTRDTVSAAASNFVLVLLYSAPLSEMVVQQKIKGTYMMLIPPPAIYAGIMSGTTVVRHMCLPEHTAHL